MSGRELEPLTAFFPSIDRNLMRDLDRHLRGAHVDDEPDAPSNATPTASAPAPSPLPSGGPQLPGSRVDITGVLEAVEHAASSMNAMAERIQELERHSQALEAHNEATQAQNHELVAQLEEAIRQRDALSANLKAEGERVQRLEGLAAHHVSRATGLERDLGVARSDLAKVVEAISNALGAPSLSSD